MLTAFVKASIFENLIVDRYFKPDFLRGFSIDYKKVINLGKDLIKEYDIRTEPLSEKRPAGSYFIRIMEAPRSANFFSSDW